MAFDGQFLVEWLVQLMVDDTYHVFVGMSAFFWGKMGYHGILHGYCCWYCLSLLKAYRWHLRRLLLEAFQFERVGSVAATVFGQLVASGAAAMPGTHTQTVQQDQAAA